MDSDERGMNPVTMTIIKPWKIVWPSPGIDPATSCSKVLYATDCAMGLGGRPYKKALPLKTLRKKR